MGKVFTVKYSIGDTVYYTIFATASIYSCKVESIYIRNSQFYYNIVRMDKDLTILDVPETEVLSFAEARTSLMNYLTLKLNQVTNLTA